MINSRNSLQKAQQRFGISAYLSKDAVKAQINAIVGRNADQFITSIISAVNANPQLQECTNASIVSAALVGQSLKLSPSPQLGQYYFVPYRNSKEGTMQAQFQIGYRGLIQLALRSGQYRKLNVLAIKEGELVRFDPINEDIEVNLIDDEEAREAAPTIGYYAMFEYLNGFRKAIYWSRSKMERHAERYSKGYAAHKGYTFWEKDFDGMAYKTMLRQLIQKWGIMSIDLQQAMATDYTIGDTVADRENPDMMQTEEPAPAIENTAKSDSVPKVEQSQTAGQTAEVFG